MIRQLLRHLYRLLLPLSAVSQSESASANPKNLSLGDILDQIAADVPEEVLAEIPEDFSRNLDHYLYGRMKR